MPGAIELRFEEPGEIENRQSYPREIIERLGALLRAGAPARRDPARDSLYEVEDGASVYYIHVSPVSQRVMLLATWRAR